MREYVWTAGICSDVTRFGVVFCGECRNMLLAGNGEHLGKESKYVGMVVVPQQSKKMYNAAV